MFTPSKSRTVLSLEKTINYINTELAQENKRLETCKLQVSDSFQKIDNLTAELGKLEHDLKAAQALEEVSSNLNAAVRSTIKIGNGTALNMTNLPRGCGKTTLVADIINEREELDKSLTVVVVAHDGARHDLFGIAAELLSKKSNHPILGNIRVYTTDEVDAGYANTLAGLSPTNVTIIFDDIGAKPATMLEIMSKLLHSSPVLTMAGAPTVIYLGTSN